MVFLLEGAAALCAVYFAVLVWSIGIRASFLFFWPFLAMVFLGATGVWGYVRTREVSLRTKVTLCTAALTVIILVVFTSLVIASYSYGDDPKEVRESLQVIRDRAELMSSLVSQLLLIARADRRIDQLVKKKTDVSLLAEEAAESLRREAENRQIQILISAPEGCYMDCDPLFMGQMFHNLIDNSLKYGRSGGTTRIEIRQEADGIRIQIGDDGIGISEEELPRIFERFYRGGQDHADRSPEEGAGLGLPIAKWIVEAHQGTLSVESKHGEGTVFQIWFPA